MPGKVPINFFNYYTRMERCQTPGCEAKGLGIERLHTKYKSRVSVIQRQDQFERMDSLMTRVKAAVCEKAVKHGKHMHLTFREVFSDKEASICEHCFLGLNAANGEDKIIFHI